jgi:alginate O-acetyltransferase complex protein AlgI
MIFTSLAFLVFFTLLYAALLFITSQRGRVNLLLVASLIFYGWWNVNYLLLIFAINLIAWYTGILIADAATERRKKLFMAGALVLMLGILAYFKYATFLLDNFTLLLDLEKTSLDILLPIGISFHTFQAISYVIDVRRGRLECCRSFIEFSLFATFFPQLVAGPIVRAVDFLPQLHRPIVLTRRNFWVGAQLFLGGALQKVLLADNLSRFVDAVYQRPDLYSSGTLWMCVLAYALQIFCDFSGYSLMAIGIARILGFELPKNFDMPYTATSIVEFWHRWHISLSTWLRDYLYISLGGNRRGAMRTKINLMITMLLGGLWHGASWNFVLWGGLHGAALIINGIWSNRFAGRAAHALGRAYAVLAWLITFLFVCLTWIPFRSPDWKTTTVFLSGLFDPAKDGALWIHPATVLALLIALVWHLLYRFAPRQLALFPAEMPALATFSRLCLLCSGVYLLVLFAPLNASPFIYFQF